jgi:hypothetical protein
MSKIALFALGTEILRWNLAERIATITYCHFWKDERFFIKDYITILNRSLFHKNLYRIFKAIQCSLGKTLKLNNLNMVARWVEEKIVQNVPSSTHFVKINA